MGQSHTQCCCKAQQVKILEESAPPPKEEGLPCQEEDGQDAWTPRMARHELRGSARKGRIKEKDPGSTGSTASTEGESNAFNSWRSEDLDLVRTDVSGLLRERHREANTVVSAFVRSMVRGRPFTVVLPTGGTANCFCSLNRGLDELRIRVREHDKNVRQVPLTQIREIIAGNAVSSDACENLETPLDEHTVTLAMKDECITFRLKDMEERDIMAMCLTLFRNELRGDRVMQGANDPAGLFADTSLSRAHSGNSLDQKSKAALKVFKAVREAEDQ